MVLKAAATIDGMRKSGGGEDVLGLVGDQLETGGPRVHWNNRTVSYIRRLCCAAGRRHAFLHACSCGSSFRVRSRIAYPTLHVHQGVLLYQPYQPPRIEPKLHRYSVSIGE